MKNLFVGNLSFGVTEDSILSALEAYGAQQHLELGRKEASAFAFVDVDQETLLVPGETANLVTQWIRTHAPVGQIREIEALAEAVIGNKQQAHRWLSDPNLALGDKAPIDLLGSEQGYERVKTLLLRIEYGVLA